METKPKPAARAAAVLAAALAAAPWRSLAGPLPALAPAQADAADLTPADAWSEPEQADGVAFRSALKGRTAGILVDAWWDDEHLRPPEDTVHVLELRYKDTNKSPVIFLTHGANGGYYQPAEVQRFGGEGDGRWKTAELAFGWDQIIRILHIDPAREKRERTAFFFRPADADLPIASLRVRPAVAGDAEAFNAATRAWVARLQADDRRRHAPRLARRRFRLRDKRQAVVAFAWPPMLALAPEAQPRDDQVGATLRIRACINETEPGSFGVHANGTSLTGLDYEVSALRDDAGNVFRGEIVRRTAEYAMSGGGNPRLLPQRFWPAYRVDVPRGRSQWLWFNVRTIRGETRPGLFRGRVTVTCDQGGAELPVELEVLPLDLPGMDECGFCAGGCLSGAVPLHDIAFQTSYNQNGACLFYTGAPTPMTMRDGKPAIDFRYMSDWFSGARRRGCQAVVYFCGGDPYGFPETLHVLRDLARMDKEGDENLAARVAWARRLAADPERILPDQRPLFQEWVRLVREESLRAGWPEWIPSPFDEPAKWVQRRLRQNDMGIVIGTGPYIKPFFKDCCAAIREADPSIRIYASIHHNNHRGQSGMGECFIPDVDIFCANCIHEDPLLGDKVRAAGKTFWQYTGAAPWSPPDQARYSFGFFFGSFDARGGLVWAYNMSGFDSRADGAAAYAWTTPFDTIPSPWFEGFREGWDDRRVMELFKRTFAGDPAKTRLLDDIRDEVLAEMASGRQQGGRDTVDDFWNAIGDVGRMDVWRNRLLDELAAAQRRAPAPGTRPGS